MFLNATLNKGQSLLGCDFMLIINSLSLDSEYLDHH